MLKQIGLISDSPTLIFIIISLLRTKNYILANQIIAAVIIALIFIAFYVFQIVLKDRHNVFVFVGYLLKCIAIWYCDADQMIFFCAQLCQVYSVYQEQFTPIQFQLLIIFMGSLNIFTIKNSTFTMTKGVAITSSIFCLIFSLWLVPKPKLKKKSLSTNSATLHKFIETSSRTLVLQNVQQPWIKLRWLDNEKLLVLNRNKQVQYINFTLADCLIDGFDQDAEDEVYNLLRQSIKVDHLDDHIQSLSDLIDHVFNLNDLEHRFVSTCITGKSYAFQNYVLNLFVLKDNKGDYLVIHFQSLIGISFHNDNLSDICKSLSHELGTNLNCISTLTDVAIQSCEYSPQIKQNLLEPISINCQQLNLIIANIRDYGAIENQNFQLKLCEFDVMEQIRTVLSFFTAACLQKSIEIIAQINPCIIMNDKDKFNQIFYQIISNAIRYTQKGSIKITTEMREGFVNVTVQDSGLGMKTHEQDNLEMILTSNQLTRVSNNSIGSGLGLFTSNQIVKKINKDPQYKITFQSSENVGSIFSFSVKHIEISIEQHNSSKRGTIFRVSNESYYEQFPQNTSGIQIVKNMNNSADLLSVNTIQSKLQQMVSRLPEQQFKFVDKIIEYSLKSKCCSRILIVDDEYFNILALKTLLQGFRSIIDVAYNGRDAIQMAQQKSIHFCPVCKNNSYQLIFLDINMPIMDGIQAVLQLKSMMKLNTIRKAYCIANSAYCDLETKLQAYEAGMDFYLVKPLNVADLNQLLLRLFPNL